MTVYNASNGELFWEHSSYLGTITLGNASILAPEIDFVFIRGTSRINPNNGSELWRVGGWQTAPPVISHGQVILWNYASAARFGGYEFCISNNSVLQMEKE